MLQLESVVKLKVQRLAQRLDDHVESGQAVNITKACHALTLDIITEIVLGQASDCIGDSNFRNEFMDHLNAAFNVGWITTAFPRLTAAALYMSSWTSLRIFPIPLLDFKRVCESRMSR